MLVALEFDAGAWDPVARTVPFALGVLVILGTFISLIRTMIVPRTTPSVLAAIVIRLTNAGFGGLARMRRGYAGRDAVLSWAGPLSVLLLLATWLALFVLGYALILYGVSPGSFPECFVAAGSGLFTLGLVGSPPLDETYVTFIAAATGPVVIALLLGFLPTMYSSYITRESSVTTLSTLAGEPAWGPEFLCRLHMLSGDSHRDVVFQQWMEWCSQIRLVQSLYPPLNRLRSPRPLRHWLTALVAILDAAALTVAIDTKGPKVAALGLLQQGTQTLDTMYDVELSLRERSALFRRHPRRKGGLVLTAEEERRIRDLPPLPGMPPGVAAVSHAAMADTLRDSAGSPGDELATINQAPLTLTRAEFDRALDVLRRAGVTVDRDPDAAWAIFARERQRYEATAYSLAQSLYAPPAPWTGPRSPATDTVWPTLAGESAPAAGNGDDDAGAPPG